MEAQSHLNPNPNPNPNNVVLVTSFINLYLREPNRSKSQDEYLQLGQQLLDLSIPKIVFLDSSIIDQFQINCDHTEAVKTNFEDLHLYQHLEHIQNQCTHSSPNPVKDTKNYLMIIAEKTFWIERAIELYPDAEHLFWIDLGILHIMPDKPTALSKISHIPAKLKVTEKILIPGCWNPKDVTLTDLQILFCDNPLWYFCGGFFGGTPKQLLQFHHFVKEKLQIMLSLNRLVFEVNIWLMIYRDHPELFDWYPADHNLSMIP